MTHKRALYLLLATTLTIVLAVTLTAVVAVAQQTPAPQGEPFLPGEPLEQSLAIFVDGGGFLGVNTEDITKENMGRYGLSSARGVGVTSVLKDSPAEKAGLRKDDVILRVDSDNVTSTRKLSRLISEVAPDHSVSLTVSRGGAEQQLAVTIGKREENQAVRGLFRGEPFEFKGPGNFNVEPKVWKWEGTPGADGVFAFGGGRRIGISTMPLTKQLGDYFGIADGKGVLVTAVGDDSPAAKAGIRAGDVITAIDGEKVEASGDISRAINQKKDGDVTLTVIRNKSQQTFRVTPKDSEFRTSGSARTGRQIVIPRIELPNIPEMNISFPGMQLPTIPQINIQMPRIIKPIKVKTVTSTRTI